MDEAPSVTLLPEPDARASLGTRPMRLRVLRPPYPALGVGVLRVIRVRDDGEIAEITAGYDRYERLARP
jgi:hypothetical protein